MSREPVASRIFVPPTMVLLVGAAALGISADRWWDLPLIFWIAMLIAAICAWIIAWSRLRKFVFSGNAVLLAWMCAGGGWHHVWWNCYPLSEVGRFARDIPAPAMVRVRLVHEPRRMAEQERTPLSSISGEPRCRFAATAIAIRNGNNWDSVSGAVEVFINGIWDGGTGGDEVELVGSLSRFEPPGNPGQFDFANFRRGERTLVWIRVRSPDAITARHKSANILNRIRACLRRYFDRSLAAHVAAEQTPVASAILLGDRLQISADERDLFLQTGTVHILAISGLHIGIMAGGLFLFLRLGILSRRTSLMMVALTVFLYAWMVGFATPVTRAAILIGLFCVARVLGVYARSITLLGTAGLLVLMMSPSGLASSGTQLSFLAVAILIQESRREAAAATNAPLRKLIRDTRCWPEKALEWVASSAWKTIRIGGAIWIHAIPLVALKFHLFSPIALVVNPLIMLPMALALYGGMVVMAFSTWFPPLAWFGGCLCDWSLDILRGLVDSAATIPGGNCWVAGPTAWSVAIYYLVLAAIALCKNHLGFVRPCAWAGIWILFGWYLPGQVIPWIKRAPVQLTVTFVDVGHGSATIIQLPNGRCAMYDGGSYGSPTTGIRNISGNLWTLGINRIDDLVISHADIDHFNAVPELCERFFIGRVWISAAMDADYSDSVDCLKNTLVRHQIETRIVRLPRTTLDLGPEVSAVLFGPGPEDLGSDNANSLVLQIGLVGEMAGFLLTGDIEGDGLPRLKELHHFDFTVAAAPHHGSLGSDPVRFCEIARPKMLIVSADRDRLNPGSLPLYSMHCKNVQSTSESGAIQVRISGSRAAFKSWVECDRSVKRWNSNASWIDLPLIRPGYVQSTHAKTTNTTIPQPTDTHDD